MASIIKDVVVDTNASLVWDALADFGALHDRLDSRIECQHGNLHWSLVMDSTRHHSRAPTTTGGSTTPYRRAV